MQVYVKETLHVLDYQDNIVGTIFNSDDHRSPGYAFNISITEANTGYSDLKFEMPNIIINDKGDKIKNPLQELLTPLVKLRYHREVYYTGEQPITVREPQGYGDEVVYIDKVYSNVYPDNIIENYIMDYIVQPVDTRRDVLKTTTTFTAMDYPRFNLSKKRVGLNIGQDTLTKDEWSLYTNEPMDVPGKIKYIKWDASLLSRIGTASFGDVPLEWDPEHATEYPLKKEHIEALMAQTAEWPYGYLATAFYWPTVSTGRFKGVMYNEGGYLILHLYDFFNLTTEGIDPELHVDRYSWEWSQLYEVEKLLCPNNAKNYLYHILNGTNWSVALKEDGITPDVDIVQTQVSNPKGSTTSFEWVDKTANVSLSNGNCYNAITSVCQALQLYPVFDCVNRTVALRQFAGKNYGLVYALGQNIKEDNTRADGEKVITKLYCTGGKDYNGDANINIGEAERSSFQNLVGFYRQTSELPQQEVEGQWAIVDSDLPVSAFKSTAYKIKEKYTVEKSSGLSASTYYLRYDISNEETYWKFTTTSTLAKGKVITYLPGDNKVTANGTQLTLTRVTNKATVDATKVLDFNDVELMPVETTVHDLSVKNYWVVLNPDHRQVYFYANNSWHLGTRLESGLWQYGDIIVDPVTGTDYSQGEWNPNDDMYISCRSPYGTNYILNLRWAYQNNWITREQILALYQYELQLHNLNIEFMDKYIEDYRLTRQLKNEAANNYDVAQDDYESTLLAMENTYNKNDKEPSQGKVHCFHKPPCDTYLNNSDGLHYIKIGHCYECGHTNTIQNNGNNPGADWTACPSCGSKDIETNPIYIPVYTDFEPYVIDNSLYPHGTMVTNTYEGHNYNPRVKGYYERLVITLDRQSGTGAQESGWSIDQYEAIVPMTKTIDYKTGAITDGYNYVLPDGTGHYVYVRSASGQIEVWNDAIRKYITRYGDMLSYHRKMLGYIHKMELLDEVYESWVELEDNINANIQLAFGDFLIEGNYTNNDQPYVGLLFNEGLEASQKYSIPEITYDLNVIDSSGLIEYREPTVTRYRCAECDYVSYTPITTCPRCENELIVTENDIYNDLVRLLHSVGQIVPKAGDYVTIYDEPMGMYGVPGLITQISRYPDNPINNKIEINTSYTDDEELVGNIITATNTVLNNSDIYARTAVLKADGTIDEKSIKDSLDNSGANITIVGTNGNILLDGSGLRATDPDADGHAIKYTGKGIFSTTNLNAAEDEAVSWTSLMTPNGINAAYISSGTIDTNKISIIAGGSARVILDQYGLGVKKDVSKTAHIYPFSASEAKTNANYTNTWGTNANLVSFIGVDQQNQPLIYTKGFLVAEEGSNIANWITDNNGFYHLNGQGNKDLWLSPSGITGTVGTSTPGTNQSFAIYANGNFGVTINGNMYAKNAVFDGSGQFSGKITVTDDSSTVNHGTVGGFDSSSTGLSKSDTIVLSPSGYNGTVTIKDGVSSNGPWAIYSKGNFGVTTGGTLWAKNGKFGGQIEAESGHIGGWTIESGKLTATGDNNKVSVVQAPASNNTWVFAAGGTSHDNYGDCPFRVSKAGALYATSANISGSITSSSISSSSITCGSAFSVTSSGTIKATSGKIGGWTINGTDGIKSDYADVRPDGSAYFYPQGSGGAEYKFNNGMTLHSTAAQTIESGANIMIDAATNLNLKSGSGSYVRIQGGLGIRINGPISVSSSYDGARENAVSAEFTVQLGSLSGGTKTLRFVNGILVSA